MKEEEEYQIAEAYDKREGRPWPTNHQKLTNKTMSKAFINYWSEEEDALLRDAVDEIGEGKWTAISERVATRTAVQCRHRWNRVLDPTLKLWTREEDAILAHEISKSKTSKINWKYIAHKIDGRTFKQCRERWRMNVRIRRDKKQTNTDCTEEVLQKATDALIWVFQAPTLHERSTDYTTDRRRMAEAYVSRQELCIAAIRNFEAAKRNLTMLPPHAYSTDGDS